MSTKAWREANPDKVKKWYVDIRRRIKENDPEKYQRLLEATRKRTAAWNQRKREERAAAKAAQEAAQIDT